MWPWPKATRRVTGMSGVPSTVLVGYRTEPNPEYNMAQAELQQAQIELQNISMQTAMSSAQPCYGAGCLAAAIGSLAGIAAKVAARGTVKTAMEKLRGTPMSLQVPVYRGYKFNNATVKASKTMTVHYYVIDRRRVTYFKSTFDVVENEDFQVAYNVEDADPKKDEIVSEFDTEDAVTDWEETPTAVALSQLVDHYLENLGEAGRCRRSPPYAGRCSPTRTWPWPATRSRPSRPARRTDPRFDSVVVIFTASGMGSGFFVRPDVVMTNYHVVEEFKFVEMKMYGGQETFGKIIAKDVRLDLALIRVQARGKPVEFYDRNNLELGSTVEVIGHPKGLEFSITRGVVSAVRKKRSANIKSEKKVLSVQIDAPISKGNSGGPVFLKERVVSVVSFMLVGKGVQNLNFTVHHAEAQRFLEDSLNPPSL